MSTFQLLAVSAVVMGMSQTVAKERIFAPLRERLGGMDTFFGYLVSCPYCLSHYFAFALVPLTGTYAIEVSNALGPLRGVFRWFLSCILVTVIAAFLRVAFWFVDESQALVRRRKKTEEVVTEKERPLCVPTVDNDSSATSPPAW